MLEQDYMNPNRQDGVPKYFLDTPEAPVPPELSTFKTLIGLGVAGGVLGLIAMLAGGRAGAFFGFVVLAGGIVLAIKQIAQMNQLSTKYKIDRGWFEEEWARAMPKPDDSRMDQWLRESKEHIKAMGFDRLHLRPDGLVGSGNGHRGQEPLVILGIPDQGSGLPLKSARGQDDEARFSHYIVTVIYLTPQKLCAYQCTLDMAADVVLTDSTHEFFHQHINTLATKTDLVLAPAPGTTETAVWVDGSDNGLPWRIATKQLMEIGVSGDRITVVVGIDQQDRFRRPDPSHGMRSHAEAMLREIRVVLEGYDVRAAGGVGAAETIN
jgi:hypothetical protein